MSFSLRGRTAAYDNIAVGSATGREQTISGALPSTEPILGGSGSSTDPGGGTSAVNAIGVSRITSASTYHSTSDPLDNYIVGSITPRGEMHSS